MEEEAQIRLSLGGFLGRFTNLANEIHWVVCQCVSTNPGYFWGDENSIWSMKCAVAGDLAQPWTSPPVKKYVGYTTLGPKLQNVVKWTFGILSYLFRMSANKLSYEKFTKELRKNYEETFDRLESYAKFMKETIRNIFVSAFYEVL